jgi:hypothetical protein
VDNQPKRLQAAALFPVVVLVIVGAFAAAYFLYPLQREPRLVKRNYRSLAVIADQVGARIEALRIAVTTNPDYCDDQHVRPLLECVEPRDLPARLPPAGSSNQSGSEVGVYIRDDNGVVNAYFMASRRSSAKSVPRTNLGRLIDEVIEPYGYFDTILLAAAGGEGKVLYQSDVPVVDGRTLYHSSISTGRIASIQELLDGERALEEQGTKDQAESGKPTGAPLSYVSSPAEVEKVRYLGEEYRLFAQPVSSTVVLMDDTSQNGLVIFGLVASHSFEAETRQIPWTWLGGLAFLLILTFLSWPLLRLWWLGPGESLRSVDVRMISFVFLMGTMVVTFFVLDLGFYASISEQFDGLLLPLAQKIELRFQIEIVNARLQLAEVLKQPGCRACSKQACNMGKPLGQRSFANLILLDSEGRPTCTWRAEADQDKKTWHLQLRRRKGQFRLQLKDRSYFRDACHQLLWGPYGVAVDVVNSRISGQDVLAVAKPVDESVVCGSPPEQGRQPIMSADQHQPAIGLIDTTMMPFAHPVLPMGYSFAIVDDQGDVQIDSEANRNKRENLFRECDDATALRAAVGASKPMHMDVSYSGHDYRIYVQPLRDTPWSLVVFRDKQLLWAVNSEIISSWAMLALLYSAVWFVAAIILQVCDATYSADWLWPCRYGGGARSYWLVATQTVLLAGITYLRLR